MDQQRENLWIFHDCVISRGLFFHLLFMSLLENYLFSAVMKFDENVNHKQFLNVHRSTVNKAVWLFFMIGLWVLSFECIISSVGYCWLQNNLQYNIKIQSFNTVITLLTFVTDYDPDIKEITVVPKNTLIKGFKSRWLD